MRAEPTLYMTRVAFALTTSMVARELGTTVARVRRLCLIGDIYPSMRVNGQWFIKPGYLNVNKMRGRGRPKGRTGAYPKGVKRPRKAAP